MCHKVIVSAKRNETFFSNSVIAQVKGGGHFDL